MSVPALEELRRRPCARTSSPAARPMSAASLVRPSARNRRAPRAPSGVRIRPVKDRRSPSITRIAGDRRAAGAVERGEEGALAGERLAGGAMMDRREHRSTSRVADAALDADRALSRRRRKLVQRHQVGDDVLPARAASGRHGRGSCRRPRPSSSLRSRVCTLPRNITTLRSGRMRRISACRRSDDEPTVAPCGRSAIDFAALPIKASRASSRGRKAESSSPSGQLRSACPSRNARRCRCGRRAALPRSPW